MATAVRAAPLLFVGLLDRSLLVVASRFLLVGLQGHFCCDAWLSSLRLLPDVFVHPGVSPMPSVGVPGLWADCWLLNGSVLLPAPRKHVAWGARRLAW